MGRLVNIKPGMSVTDVAKKCDITYSHVTKIIHKMISMGWIKCEKSGRTNVVTLTKAGMNKQAILAPLFHELQNQKGYK